jgi:Family of unknown function (DUF6152)
MKSRLTFLTGGVVALVLALSSPLNAHHGWAGNGEKEFELTGTLEKAVSLAGPHATMQIRAEGKVWDVTLAPPARTERAGLTEKVIPLGATVTVHGHRNSDPNKFEIKTERVTWNGKTFAVYPDRK